MDSTKLSSSSVSGDLTSTMESVLGNNGQEKQTDGNEAVSVGDSVPSSSSDAYTHTVVTKTIQDDPISSTSDTVNSEAELNLKRVSACDLALLIGAGNDGGASNTNELVTDTDFFSSELSIGSISTEKISEDVEDIANDLENLLGESSHEYSISSNTDKQTYGILESHYNKDFFDGATQTKDITTTGTAENMQFIEGGDEVVKQHIEELTVNQNTEIVEDSQIIDAEVRSISKSDMPVLHCVTNHTESISQDILEVDTNSGENLTEQLSGIESVCKGSDPVCQQEACNERETTDKYLPTKQLEAAEVCTQQSNQSQEPDETIYNDQISKSEENIQKDSSAFESEVSVLVQVAERTETEEGLPENQQKEESETKCAAISEKIETIISQQTEKVSSAQDSDVVDETLLETRAPEKLEVEIVTQETNKYDHKDEEDLSQDLSGDQDISLSKLAFNVTNIELSTGCAFQKKDSLDHEEGLTKNECTEMKETVGNKDDGQKSKEKEAIKDREGNRKDNEGEAKRQETELEKIAPTTQMGKSDNKIANVVSVVAETHDFTETCEKLERVVENLSDNTADSHVENQPGLESRDKIPIESDIMQEEAGRDELENFEYQPVPLQTGEETVNKQLDVVELLNEVSEEMFPENVEESAVGVDCESISMPESEDKLVTGSDSVCIEIISEEKHSDITMDIEEITENVLETIGLEDTSDGYDECSENYVQTVDNIEEFSQQEEIKMPASQEAERNIEQFDEETPPESATQDQFNVLEEKVREVEAAEEFDESLLKYSEDDIATTNLEFIMGNQSSDLENEVYVECLAARAKSEEESNGAIKVLIKDDDREEYPISVETALKEEHIGSSECSATVVSNEKTKEYCNLVEDRLDLLSTKLSEHESPETETVDTQESMDVFGNTTQPSVSSSKDFEEAVDLNKEEEMKSTDDRPWQNFISEESEIVETNKDNCFAVHIEEPTSIEAEEKEQAQTEEVLTPSGEMDSRVTTHSGSADDFRETEDAVQPTFMDDPATCADIVSEVQEIELRKHTSEEGAIEPSESEQKSKGAVQELEQCVDISSTKQICITITESALEEGDCLTGEQNLEALVSAREENNEDEISMELKVQQSLKESVEAICAISKEEMSNQEETPGYEILEEAQVSKVTSEVSSKAEVLRQKQISMHHNHDIVEVEIRSLETFVADNFGGEPVEESQENLIGDPDDGDGYSLTLESIGQEALCAKEHQNELAMGKMLPNEDLTGLETDKSLQRSTGIIETVFTNQETVSDPEQFEVEQACKFIAETNDETQPEERQADGAVELDDTVCAYAKETSEIQVPTVSVDVRESQRSENLKQDSDPVKLDPEALDEALLPSSTVEDCVENIVKETSTVPQQAVDDDVPYKTGRQDLAGIEKVSLMELVPDYLQPEDVKIHSGVPDKTPPFEVIGDQAPQTIAQTPLLIEIETKQGTSEYSSKISANEDLKMTITKHKVEDSSAKHESVESESVHSILKIYDPQESVSERAQEKESIPRLIIKPVVKPQEEAVPKITIKPIVERSSILEAQLSPKTFMKNSSRPESPNKMVTRSQKCDIVSPFKLTIKPVLKPEETQQQQQKSSPKLTIKPIVKIDDSASDSPSPKITIKPIIRPPEEEIVHNPKITIKPIIKHEGVELPHNPRITIKPVVKPSEQENVQPEREEMTHSPRITIKPVMKPAEQDMSIDREEMTHSPRITIKPIVKPVDDQRTTRQESPIKQETAETSHSPRITIKPIIKPDDSKASKQECGTTSPETSHSPRITIKPIVKPVEDQKASKQETSIGSPKITIKPIVKPQDIEMKTVELIDFEEQIKQERIVLKINKTTKSSRKRQVVDDTEKLAKIKVKYSRERGRAQIVSGQGKLKRALEGSLDPDMKRTRFQAGDLTITAIDPIVDQTQKKIETSKEALSKGIATNTGSGFEDPLEHIPVFEITPESAAIMKSAPPVAIIPVQPVPPAPRKRGRPRKVPLVVREEFNDVVVKEVAATSAEAGQAVPPPAEETGRPKRSCRGPSVRTTLGIRTRRPRGSGRGRGRGRGSRGGGTRGGRQQRISAAKLKLLKEEAAAAIAEESNRLEFERQQKDVEMKEEPSENVAAGSNSDLVLIEEETRMSADINSSRAQTPAKQILTPAPGDVEDTQSSVQSSATTESVKARKGTRLEVHQEPEGEVISADQLAEYYWGGGGPYMLQEQVAQFLGIKSFKRKYPGINRRPVEMQERDFIRESGLASEAMCDLGLTAVNSADILDIMYSDFQHKYEEYCKHQRDRQAKDFTNKQKALSLAASQEKNKLDITQQAVQSAASWNATFNKARREERKACMDLQTFTVHYPKGKMKKIDTPKVGHYPVALVPGQFTDYYRNYTPTELNNLPLNTMLYKPINVHQEEDSHSDGSGSESDSSSSSSDSSSSDSSVDEDCNVCSPASSTNKKVISTAN